MDDAIPGLRQKQAPQVCATHSPGPGPPPAPATPAPLGLSSRPPQTAHTPHASAPSRGGGRLQPSGPPRQTSAFPPRHYTLDQGSELLPLGFHSIPGSAGGIQDAGSPELPAEPRGRSWPPDCKVKKLRLGKRGSSTLVSGCTGPGPARTCQWSLPRAPSRDGKGGHHGRQGPGGRQVTTGPHRQSGGTHGVSAPQGGSPSPPKAEQRPPATRT